MQKKEQLPEEAVCLFYKINIVNDITTLWNFGKIITGMPSLSKKKKFDTVCILLRAVVPFRSELCLHFSTCKHCWKKNSKLSKNQEKSGLFIGENRISLRGPGKSTTFFEPPYIFSILIFSSCFHCFFRRRPTNQQKWDGNGMAGMVADADADADGFGGVWKKKCWHDRHCHRRQHRRRHWHKMTDPEHLSSVLRSPTPTLKWIL